MTNTGDAPVRSSTRLVSRSVAAVVVATALAACTSMLDMEAVKAAISAGIAGQTGLEIATVTCPADREIKTGDVFECTASPSVGGELVVQVTQDDDAGNITWSVTQTNGLLDLTKVVAAVHDGLMQQASVDAAVDCGVDKYRAAIPGDTFTCNASTTDGQQAVVDIEVVDAEGNVNWSIAQQ